MQIFSSINISPTISGYNERNQRHDNITVASWVCCFLFLFIVVSKFVSRYLCITCRTFYGAYKYRLLIFPIIHMTRSATEIITIWYNYNDFSCCESCDFTRSNYL